MKVYRSNCLINHTDTAETNVENMAKAAGKYSKFNTDWIFNNKYQPDAPIDPNKSSAISMYGRPIQMRDGAFTPTYYPAEKWYRDNINRV